MKQKKSARFRQPTPNEQEILTHLLVRPVGAEEIERFDQFIAEHHYLKNGQLVGEHLRYEAEYQGQWLALASWSAPALHIKARDRFIGWSEEQRRAPGATGFGGVCRDAFARPVAGAGLSHR